MLIAPLRFCRPPFSPSCLQGSLCSSSSRLALAAMSVLWISFLAPPSQSSRKPSLCWLPPIAHVGATLCCVLLFSVGNSLPVPQLFSSRPFLCRCAQFIPSNQHQLMKCFHAGAVCSFSSLATEDANWLFDCSGALSKFLVVVGAFLPATWSNHTRC